MINTTKRLYIEYKITVEGGEPEDPLDHWSYYSSSYTELEVVGISKTQQNFFDCSLEVDEETYNQDKVWLVVKRYSDSGTFQTLHGLFSFEGIGSTKEQASHLEQRIRAEAHELDDVDLYNLTVRP